MCGIVGVIGPSASQVRLNRIRHRGPDGDGTRVVNLKWGVVTLGMARLAIVDTQPIAVPFSFPYLKLTLAYNGEVYNWRELRAELSDSQPWMTECDAEVVARAWRQWGPAALQRFNGMFAIAVVDELHDSLTLIRDRAGEKPLFYARRGDGFTFASEIKALALPAFHEVECADADLFEFDCLETTPFRDVMRLSPGHLISIERPEDLARPRLVEWWRLPDALTRTARDYTSVRDELRETLVDAIQLRATPQRPVTTYVSGGLDSAIIQAIAKMNQVYCVTFDAADAVIVEARHAALLADVVSVSFDLDATLAALPRIAWHLDTPATWSAVAHWFLARQVERDGFRVVLSGEGADELFGGYSRYRILWHIERLRADANLSAYRSYVDFMFGDDLALLTRMIDRSQLGERDRATAIVERFAPTGTLTERMMRIDWHTTMQCLLRMGDRMTAAFGIENRAPFLDHRIIELAAAIPMEWKITASESKSILRDVARSLGVLERIAGSKVKRGLVVPWPKWRPCGTGRRGAFDRADFAQEMTKAWREAWADHNVQSSTTCDLPTPDVAVSG